MAPDWARRLAPVGDQVTRRWGRFLRAEVGGGPRLPAPRGDQVFRAFQRPLADVRVLVVGRDLPDAGHPVASFAVQGVRAAAAANLVNIYRLRSDLGIETPSTARPDQPGRTTRA